MLATIIDKAQHQGLIKGVVPNLISRGVSLLQYADDIILMLELKEDYILNMKFLLYCFEWMSGLKINYHKSEIFVVGVNKVEAQNVAKKLDCKLGQFPLTYLGISIGDREIKRMAADKMISKIENRLGNWKSRLLSSGED